MNTLFKTLANTDETLTLDTLANQHGLDVDTVNYFVNVFNAAHAANPECLDVTNKVLGWTACSVELDDVETFLAYGRAYSRQHKLFYATTGYVSNYDRSKSTYVGLTYGHS